MSLTSGAAAVVRSSDKPLLGVQLLTADAYANTNAKPQDLDAFYNQEEKDSKSDSIETGTLEKSVNGECDILAAKGKLR